LRSPRIVLFLDRGGDSKIGLSGPPTAFGGGGDPIVLGSPGGGGSLKM